MLAIVPLLCRTMSWGQWWSSSSGSGGASSSGSGGPNWWSLQGWQQWQPQSWWSQGDDAAQEDEGKVRGKRKREGEEEEREEGGGLPPQGRAGPLTQAQAARAEKSQWYKDRGQFPRQGDTSDRGHVLSVPVPFGPVQMGQMFNEFKEYAQKEGLKLSIRAMRHAAWQDKIASKEFPNSLTLRGPKGDYGAPLRAIQLLEDMFIMMADNNICDPTLLPGEQVEEASDSEGDEAHTVETTLYGVTTRRLKRTSKVLTVVAQAWQQPQEPAGARPALQVHEVRMPKYAKKDRAPCRTLVAAEEQQQRLKYLQERFDHLVALKIQAETVQAEPAPAGLSADTAGLSAVGGGLKEAKGEAQEAEQQDEQQEAKKEEPEEETGDSPPLSREQFLAALRSAEDELSWQRETHQVSDSKPDWQEEALQRDLQWASLADQRDIALEIASQCVDRQFGRKDAEFKCGP